MAENGEPKMLPTIVIAYDEATKEVHHQINWEGFKNYQFVYGVLEMFKSKLQNEEKQVMMQNMVQAQREAQQTAAIQRDLQKRRIT